MFMNNFVHCLYLIFSPWGQFPEMKLPSQMVNILKAFAKYCSLCHQDDVMILSKVGRYQSLETSTIQGIKCKKEKKSAHLFSRKWKLIVNLPFFEQCWAFFAYALALIVVFVLLFSLGSFILHQHVNTRIKNINTVPHIEIFFLVCLFNLYMVIFFQCKQLEFL